LDIFSEDACILMLVGFMVNGRCESGGNIGGMKGEGFFESWLLCWKIRTKRRGKGLWSEINSWIGVVVSDLVYVFVRFIKEMMLIGLKGVGLNGIGIMCFKE
ncbi:hypothetical protein, partial [Bacillus pumilus]|uniref:hypothetical protein n=1 Tax=Bacillus pumilus TaxID=1408 RepID=UPI001C92F390